MAVWSTCPCTMWPSRRPSSLALRSRFTLSPGLSIPRLDFSSVSLIAVTVYSSPFFFTTVRHTPLWDILWSILSSFVKEHFIVMWMLSLSFSILTTGADSSTIPENIGVVVSWFYKDKQTVQRYNGTTAQRDKGTTEQRDNGTTAQRHNGTTVQRHKGTKAQRYNGTTVQRHN